MLAAPEETLTVTLLFLATLLPLSGFVLITKPFFTDVLACCTSTGFSPAALICCSACDHDKPFTSGTLTLLPLPLPFIRTTATTTAALVIATAVAVGLLVAGLVTRLVASVLVRGHRGGRDAHHGSRAHLLGALLVVVDAGRRLQRSGHLHARGGPLDVRVHFR